jgi:predicted DNA-binding protein
MKQPTSYRLPRFTLDQIEQLRQATQMTQAEIVQTAVDRMYREDAKMKYTIEVKRNGDTISETPGYTQSQAVREAKSEAVANPGCHVFITWFRQSDGQRGYLNPGGNHEITGLAW